MNKNDLYLGLTSLKVKYKEQLVGLPALADDKKEAFYYDEK